MSQPIVTGKDCLGEPVAVAGPALADGELVTTSLQQGLVKTGG